MTKLQKYAILPLLLLTLAMATFYPLPIASSGLQAGAETQAEIDAMPGALPGNMEFSSLIIDVAFYNPDPAEHKSAPEIKKQPLQEGVPHFLQENGHLPSQCKFRRGNAVALNAQADCI